MDKKTKKLIDIVKKPKKQMDLDEMMGNPYMTFPDISVVDRNVIDSEYFYRHPEMYRTNLDDED